MSFNGRSHLEKMAKYKLNQRKVFGETRRRTQASLIVCDPLRGQVKKEYHRNFTSQNKELIILG